MMKIADDAGVLSAVSRMQLLSASIFNEWHLLSHLAIVGANILAPTIP